MEPGPGEHTAGLESCAYGVWGLGMSIMYMISASTVGRRTPTLARRAAAGGGARDALAVAASTQQRHGG